MRNIETFPSKQMYPYLSLVERKVAEFSHNIDSKALIGLVKMTYFHHFFNYEEEMVWRSACQPSPYKTWFFGSGKMITFCICLHLPSWAPEAYDLELMIEKKSLNNPLKLTEIICWDKGGKYTRSGQLRTKMPKPENIATTAGDCNISPMVEIKTGGPLLPT